MRIKEVVDGVEIEHPYSATGIQVLDIDGNFPKHNLEDVLRVLGTNISTRIFVDKEVGSCGNGYYINSDDIINPDDSSVDAVGILKKYISSNISNSSLLINGDFRSPVNQRALTTYSGSNIYTIDRWITNFNPTITVQAGSIRMNSGATGSSFGGIRQLIENFKHLAGQTVTLSLNVKNIISGSWNLGIQTFNTKDSSKFYSDVDLIDTTGLVTRTITLPTDLSPYDRFQFMVYSDNQNTEIELEWAKLELGSISTPFVARSYGEELLLCRRYYQKVRYIGTAIGGSTTVGTNNLSVNQTIPITMRISPTLVIPDSILYDTQSNTNVSVTVSSYNTKISEVNNLMFKEYSVYIGKVYSLILNLDAEIY